MKSRNTLSDIEQVPYYPCKESGVWMGHGVRRTEYMQLPAAKGQLEHTTTRAKQGAGWGSTSESTFPVSQGKRGVGQGPQPASRRVCLSGP